MKLVSKNTLLVVLLAATSYGAFAADSVDLKVIGTIVPASCTPTISGGGVVDFGRIPASSLSATVGTVLPSKEVTLSVSCDAPAKVGITTVDDRSGTVGHTAESALGLAGTQTMGVGLVSGKMVGAYGIAMEQGTGTADGAVVDSIYSQDSGVSWAKSGAGMVQPGIRTHSWAATGSLVPGAFQTISQPMRITLGLNSTAELPALTSEVPIDGLATFSLVYL